MTRLVHAWLRTLLVQASFSFDRMIGVGTAWAIQPLLKDLPEERYRAAMQRATRFFNAHPYFAGMAIGAIARVEHEDLPPETVDRLRHALVSPLGSVGDKLIWAGLMPAAVGIGLTVGALVSPVTGALTFLALYNVGHFALRTWALREGWSKGREVSRALTARGIQRGLRLAGPVGGFAVGVAIPIVGGWLARGFLLQTKLSVALVAVLAVAFAQWILPSFRGLRFGAVAAAAALVVGWLW
jgi:mannose/fructose/N-acetylgalactosamine-specific phosphotransferase system component IID